VQQESVASAKKAQAEASRIIDEAGKAAKEFLEKQQQESAAKANEILVRAQQVIELEKRKMLAEARTEIARLVVATTQRVLSKDLSDADRTRYSESAARELNNV
jgi:F-type H+-transporting ATPase subunit b